MAEPRKIENCVVLRPTMEEFKDETKFLSSEVVQEAGKKCGIVRVVCPPEYQPSVAKNNLATSENSRESIQVLETIFPEILPYRPGDGYYQVQRRQIDPYETDKHLWKSNAEKWKILTEKAMKKELRNRKKNKVYKFAEDPRTHYWESRPHQLAAFYGCDIPETLMKEDLNCWNFGSEKFPCLTNNIPEEDRTPGICTPYLYFGSWGTSFGLHCEDKDLYSLNYLHEGESKFWYGFPSSVSSQVEQFARELLPDEAAVCGEFVRHKSILVEPRHYLSKGIPVFSAEQKPGDLMITFPNAYHYGFNNGFNVAESRNIATLDWLEWGLKAKSCDCPHSKGMGDVLPLKVIIDMAKQADPVKYKDLHIEQTPAASFTPLSEPEQKEPAKKRVRRM